jgi:hypothetical protein
MDMILQRMECVSLASKLLLAGIGKGKTLVKDGSSLDSLKRMPMGLVLAELDAERKDSTQPMYGGGVLVQSP